MDTQTRALHVGAGSQGSLNRAGQHVCSVDRPSAARGCREKGAGRKDYYVAYKIMLKEWVQLERDNGHSLDMSDLVLQWFFYAEETKKGLQEREKDLQPEDRIAQSLGPLRGSLGGGISFLLFFGIFEPFGAIWRPDSESS